MGTEGTLCKFTESNISDILQCDGADSLSETSSNDSLCSSESKEADSNPVRAVLVPAQEQGPQGTPLRLEVELSGTVETPTYVPLSAVTNPRSC